jgi:hypothetical protein
MATQSRGHRTRQFGFEAPTSLSMRRRLRTASEQFGCGSPLADLKSTLLLTNRGLRSLAAATSVELNAYERR